MKRRDKNNAKEEEEEEKKNTYVSQRWLEDTSVTERESGQSVGGKSKE